MKEYLDFPAMQRNDHVRILCTARHASVTKLAPAVGWLKSLGYKVSLGKSIGKRHHQYGGSNEERLNDFMDALRDPGVHAIWVARGGYGSVKIVDQIDMSVLGKSNKLLLGYSDITHLHGLWQKNGLQSVHTFMPQELSEKPEEVLRSLRRAITGRFQTVALPFPSQEKYMITAPVVGGNLSVLASMLGSHTFPDMDGRILFLEDVDELLYHIDRLMTMLKRAGKLDTIKALIVGGLSNMRDHDTPFGKSAEDIIREHTADFDYPVIFDFPAGHVKDNNSFILGKSTTIVINKNIVTISQ